MGVKAISGLPLTVECIWSFLFLLNLMEKHHGVANRQKIYVSGDAIHNKYYTLRIASLGERILSGQSRKREYSALALKLTKGVK